MHDSSTIKGRSKERKKTNKVGDPRPPHTSVISKLGRHSPTDKNELILVQYWPIAFCFQFQKAILASCFKIVVSEKHNWSTVFCFLFQRSGCKKGNIGPVSPCSRLPGAQACQIMSFQLDTRLPSPLKKMLLLLKKNFPSCSL